MTDRRGTVERLPLPSGSYETPRASPDGRRIVFGTDDGKEAIVWVYDLDRAAPARRLTFGGNARFPTWLRDGTHVAFQFDRDGDAAVFWQAIDGSPAERLTRPADGEAHEPEAWTSSGDDLVFSSTKANEVTLQVLSLKTRTTCSRSGTRPLFHGSFPVHPRRREGPSTCCPMADSSLRLPLAPRRRVSSPLRRSASSSTGSQSSPAAPAGSRRAS